MLAMNTNLNIVQDHPNVTNDVVTMLANVNIAQDQYRVSLDKDNRPNKGKCHC